MGGGATGISIFMKKHMIYADTVRLGGDHVTLDISKGLQIPMGTAERIKTFHGGLVATGMDDREMIEIGGDTGDWELDRLHEGHPKLPIIVITAHSDLENAVAAYKGGAFEYLPKPFDLPDLMKRAARALEVTISVSLGASGSRTGSSCLSLLSTGR